MTGKPEGKEAGMGFARIRIWDLPTRLFHWLLAALLLLSWFSGSNKYWDLHATSGYLLAGLLLFRLGWGIFGSRTARFTDFVRGPGAVIRYLSGVLRGTHQPWIGHNPAGGLMVLALLLAVAAQVGSGLFATDDILFEGPLRQFVSSGLSADMTWLHHWLFYLLLVLAIVHVLAVAAYWIVKRENLILPMITGRTARTGKAQPQARPGKHFVNDWVGLIVLVLVLAAVFALLDLLAPF